MGSDVWNDPGCVSDCQTNCAAWRPRAQAIPLHDAVALCCMTDCSGTSSVTFPLPFPSPSPASPTGALGLGASVSAVTFLFWLAVLLLVVYTQNIILAIVAEAYERAKDQLGTADTSFPKLVFMRILCWGTMLYLSIRDACAPLCRRLPSWCRSCNWCCCCGATCCPCNVAIKADQGEGWCRLQGTGAGRKGALSQ